MLFRRRLYWRGTTSVEHLIVVALSFAIFTNFIDHFCICIHINGILEIMAYNLSNVKCKDFSRNIKLNLLGR